MEKQAEDSFWLKEIVSYVLIEDLKQSIGHLSRTIGEQTSELRTGYLKPKPVCAVIRFALDYRNHGKIAWWTGKRSFQSSGSQRVWI